MSEDPILAALNRLEAGQVSLSDEMAVFRAGVLNELGKTRGAIMDKVGEVQNGMTAIRDDIAVNMGGIDAARKANENTRSDVQQMQEQMSVMWKQIKRLESRVREITGDP